MIERWYGATGQRVPAILVEGEEQLPTGVEPLVLDAPDDRAAMEEAHAAGRPVVVRVRTAEEVARALARPEVSCVLVPPEARALKELDLTELTYG